MTAEYRSSMTSKRFNHGWMDFYATQSSLIPGCVMKSLAIILDLQAGLLMRNSGVWLSPFTTFTNVIFIFLAIF